MGYPLTLELQIIVSLFIFLTGLCVGSFLNVCIYRIPLEKSIVFPPSSCPGCNARLHEKDLVPVASYILLGGKCRYCKSKISLQYPLIELLTGILWLAVYLKFGFTVETAAFIYLFSILTAIFFIDLKHMIIPNGLVLLAIAGGALIFVYNLFKPFTLFQSTYWYTPLIGMFSASGILFIVSIIGFLIYKNDGAMGMGDVKLFIPIGMFLGWKLALFALFVSIMAGGIISIFLLIFKIKDRKSAIPFGPFIIIGTFIAVMYGSTILNWNFL